MLRPFCLGLLRFPFLVFPSLCPFNFQLSIEDPDHVGTVDLC
jgi:hypothetical protein